MYFKIKWVSLESGAYGFYETERGIRAFKTHEEAERTARALTKQAPYETIYLVVASN